MKKGGWRKALIFICLILVLVPGCSGSLPDIIGTEEEIPEEENSFGVEPHTKEDGSRYRLALVDLDEYLPSARQFFYIVQGLEEYGWIREGSLPVTIEEIEKTEMAIDVIYDKLVEADLGEYVEFAEGGMHYIAYEDEKKVAKELKERAGKDIDLIIASGTGAGQFVKGLELPIPMVDYGATDPVASGIIDSATEGSGNPNIWAQVESSVPLRQMKYYYSVKPFKKLGMIIYGDEIISGVPDIMKAAREVGFSVVKYNIPEQPRETEEELEAYYKMVKQRFEYMAMDDIDAFFFTLDLVNDPDKLPEMFEPLYEKNIPIYCLDDKNNVYNGALMIIAAFDEENVGRFVADAVTKILSGEEAGSLPCVYTSAPYICLNYDVARKIDYPLSFEFLAACDEIYTERKSDEQ
ncbi:MAG: hypothetical protein IKO11_06820 [Lachnospiraceae bacterium]|nr:hypothetical protein [Lachnospiraceae bacterium]